MEPGCKPQSVPAAVDHAYAPAAAGFFEAAWSHDRNFLGDMDGYQEPRPSDRLDDLREFSLWQTILQRMFITGENKSLGGTNRLISICILPIYGNNFAYCSA